MVTPGSTYSDVLGTVDRILRQAVRYGVFPGAAVWISYQGETVNCSAYGFTTDKEYDSYPPEPVAIDTLYDLASLTKVIVTTPAILQLTERGLLTLADPVSKYVPRFGTDPQKRSVTIWHILTHTSGLAAHVDLYRQYRGKDAIIEAVCQQDLLFPPGSRHLYTDLGFVLLGEVVDSVSGLPLDEYARTHILEPLGMKSTVFSPARDCARKVAPTEYVEWRGGLVRAEVHDELAWAMGGVAGHAGVFSSVVDLAKFCKMLLGLEEHPCKRILEWSSISRMTSVQGLELDRSYGLGWWLNTPRFMGDLASSATFGHTGFTGTSIVIEPVRKLAVVLLSNRVCPTRHGPDINPYRRMVGNALAKLV